MTSEVPAFNPGDLSLTAGGVRLSGPVPLINGEPIECGEPDLLAEGDAWRVVWRLPQRWGERVVLGIAGAADRTGLRLELALEGVPAGARLDSLGVRFRSVEGVIRYLRNGYTSWDGSYFIEPENARGLLEAVPGAVLAYAMTAFVAAGGGVAVLGYLRHDRYQSRIRFDFAAGPLALDLETLLDRVAHEGLLAAEALILLGGTEVEETLRQWARQVARISPLEPRIQAPRITGWCSWYNLYSSLSEPVLLEHLGAAARFRDRWRVAFDIFQIDDGFVPEMGDWLDAKPQFPRGMAPLLAQVRAAGFVPGLWIAPFMVGNRSRLYEQHPDWVVCDRGTGKPIVPMKFHGEFRWHKRSEEYYILDITNPAAEAWMRQVLRVWRRDWGCGYFKTDFMYFGAEYGPEQARWHVSGLSRMAVWMRMARLIREEIGDALWLACGGPIWAPVGLVDAVRIGRDIGVSWHGHYSAESLLRDQATRNFANGILWQADPDCILLRERFHDLSDAEVRSLATFAGLSGGVLMTSDQLDEVSEERRALLATLAKLPARPCDFPDLGRSTIRHRRGTGHLGQQVVIGETDPVLIQRVHRPDGVVLLNVFNTGDVPAERLIPWSMSGFGPDSMAFTSPGGHALSGTDQGVRVRVPPHANCLCEFRAASRPRR